MKAKGLRENFSNNNLCVVRIDPPGPLPGKKWLGPPFPSAHPHAGPGRDGERESGKDGQPLFCGSHMGVGAGKPAGLGSKCCLEAQSHGLVMLWGTGSYPAGSLGNQPPALDRLWPAPRHKPWMHSTLASPSVAAIPRLLPAVLKARQR